MEWSGVEWSGVEWSGKDCLVILAYCFTARVQYVLFLNGAIDKLVPLLTDGSEQTVVNTLFILYTLSKNRKYPQQKGDQWMGEGMVDSGV